jgi:hypothetical protein
MGKLHCRQVENPDGLDEWVQVNVLQKVSNHLHASRLEVQRLEP